MFSSDLKCMIAGKVQQILKDINHPELPKGEIQFLLHVDGAENWSWANIRNNIPSPMEIPESLVKNTTI